MSTRGTEVLFPDPDRWLATEKGKEIARTTD